MFMGAIIGTTDVLLNMSDPSEREIQEHEELTSSWSPFIGGLAFAFILYIIMLVLTFVIANKTKALGIILIVIGFIAMVITNFWGIIPFALLLPAGIVALRYKPLPSRSRKYDDDRDEDDERIITGGGGGSPVK
jgi:glucan phosphoethanolaminetransferase (alkaline phosphatase superfamily)